MATKKVESANDELGVRQPDKICGIIMPISATANHTEAHWVAVRTLLGRAIEKAGLVAAPVWENSAADRISERIIGNIFQFPIVVADITDGNPNVMLELGLRLASKKPTIVIASIGAAIPFDIRDFHAVLYPPSLSMLEMEAFIDELSVTLHAKLEAVAEDGYIPFLGRVVVDVVQPGEREVPIQQYLLDRLDEINAKISRQSFVAEKWDAKSAPANETRYTTNALGTAFFLTSSSSFTEKYKENLRVFTGAEHIVDLGKLANGSARFYALVFPEVHSDEDIIGAINSIQGMLVNAGARLGIPTAIARNAAVF